MRAAAGEAPGHGPGENLREFTHAFNNALASIVGHLDLAASICTEEAVKRHLEAALAAGLRARELTAEIDRRAPA